MIILEGHSKRVCALTFSPNGKQLASGSYDHTCRVWNLQTMKQEHSWLPRGKVSGLWFDPNGEYLIAHLIRNNYVEILRRWKPGALRSSGTYCEQYAPIRGTCFSPDGQLLATTIGEHRSSSAVGFWNPSVWKERIRAWETGEAIYQIADHPVKEQLAIQLSRSIRIVSSVSLETLKVLHVKADHSTPYNHLTFSPNGSLLLTANGQTVQVFETEHWSRLVKWRPSDRCIRSIAFVPKADCLALVYDHLVRFYETLTWTEIQCMDWGIGRSRTLAFSPDGCLAAVGANNGPGKIVLWDLDDHW